MMNFIKSEQMHTIQIIEFWNMPIYQQIIKRKLSKIISPMESEQQAFDQSEQQNPEKKITTPGKMKDSGKGGTLSKQAISKDQVKELYKARSNFQQFVQMIGSLRFSAIRNDVIEHCDKLQVNISLQLMAYDHIQFFIQNRIDKIIKNKKIKKNWSQQDVFILLWIISKYSDYHSFQNLQNSLNMQTWEQIASMIPGITVQSCMFKWLSLKKVILAQNCWSKIESQTLDFVIKKYGPKNWNLVSQQVYILNKEKEKAYRSPKQCREHWNCYLNPKLKKGPWTKEEDIKLMEKIVEYNGRKKWAQFIKFFNGRTENALKNRYALLLQKQMKTSKVLDEGKIIQEYLQKACLEQPVSKLEHFQENYQTCPTLSIKNLKSNQVMALRERRKKIIPKKCEKFGGKQILQKLEKQEGIKNSEDEDLQDREVNIKVQGNIKQQNIQKAFQESSMQSIDNHFIRSEFSDFTPAKVEIGNYFNQGENNLKVDAIEPKFLLPSVENIQVVPFNIETFSGLKDFSKDVVPCQMIQNKLYQFQEK